MNGACSITGGTGVASGSFTVGNVNPGTYVIQVQGNTGDTAQASFTVTTGASITLNPSSGGVGRYRLPLLVQGSERMIAPVRLVVPVSRTQLAVLRWVRVLPVEVSLSLTLRLDRT